MRTILPILAATALTWLGLLPVQAQNNAPVNQSQQTVIVDENEMPGYEPYGLLNAMPGFLEDIKHDLGFPMAWRNSGYKDFGRWRKAARQQLFDCMGQLPPTSRSFDYLILEREQRNGYQALKIVFDISGYCRIPAYLLVPDGEGRFPALVALHDHGARFTIGKEKMIRPIGQADSEKMQEAENWAVSCYDGVFTGDFFAQNGFVVLSIDAIFWGERGRKEGASYEAQQAFAANLFQLGMNWCGLITFDDMQSVEFLSRLPFVDARRIAAYGHSMGAHRAWMLAAASEKVKAGVAVCWMNTTRHLMTATNNQNKGGSAYSMLLPDIRRYLDYPDVASIACPKPMYFMNGRQDKLFPVEGVEDAYKIMRQVWSSQDADWKLKTELWDVPHFFSRDMQQQALEFFKKQL